MACMAYMIPLMNSKGWEVCPRPAPTAKKAPKGQDIIIEVAIDAKDAVETITTSEAVKEIPEADKITIAEAAELSGLTKAAIKGRMQTGKIKNVGVPGAPKVLKSEIEAIGK